MHKIPACIILLLALSLISHLAPAEERKPTTIVQELLESISMIKDGSTIKLSPEERKQNNKLINKANSLIDIPGLGPKTLGSHWIKRKPKEKTAFLSTLTKLFAKVAYPKSSKFFKDLKIKYNSEKIKKGKAVVNTSMEHESEGLIEIDYKLHKVNGKWFINDVILDDVSLVINLKAKFYKIVKEESFDELMSKMNKRLKEED